MPGSSPGMTPPFGLISLLFSDSHFKQPALTRNLKAANRRDSSSPLLVRRGGRPLFPSLTPMRERSAERRLTVLAPCEGAARFAISALASRRSTVASLDLGTVLTGLGPKGINPLVSRAAFAALVPCPSQPFKAAPRSRDGRRPETTRGVFARHNRRRHTLLHQPDAPSRRPQLSKACRQYRV